MVLAKPGEAPANRSPPPSPAPQPAEHEIKVKNLRMANGSGYIYNYDTVRDVLDDKELVRGDALGVDSWGKRSRMGAAFSITRLPRVCLKK